MLSTFRTTYACKVFVSSSCVVFVVLVGAVLLLQLRDRFELLSFEPRGRGFFSFFFFSSSLFVLSLTCVERGATYQGPWWKL